MSQRFWLFVLFWFLSLPVLFGQADSLFVYLQARLVNAENGEAVPYAHILLKYELSGITSDDNGYFDLNSPEKDSLLISSIGFENLHLAVRDLRTDSTLNIIRLIPQVYMLGEIKITQYATYDEMVETITNPIYTESEKRLLRAYSRLEEVGLSFMPRKRDLHPRISGGPITGIYNLFSRTEKYRKKYQKLKEEESKDLRFRKKISNEMISRLTGLTDSITIIQFIRYCNFSESYLNSSNEYELFNRIKQNYKAFKQEK